MSVLRCTACRLLVDSPSNRCASCGGPLAEGSAPGATVWDEDDPTVRRPVDYFTQLGARSSSR